MNHIVSLEGERILNVKHRACAASGLFNPLHSSAFVCIRLCETAAKVSASRLPQPCGVRALLAYAERLLPTAVYINFAVYILHS